MPQKHAHEWGRGCGVQKRTAKHEKRAIWAHFSCLARPMPSLIHQNTKNMIYGRIFHVLAYPPPFPTCQTPECTPWHIFLFGVYLLDTNMENMTMCRFFRVCVLPPPCQPTEHVPPLPPIYNQPHATADDNDSNDRGERAGIHGDESQL